MGVQHPVGADLALEVQHVAEGGQQQLDGRAVVADAVVQAGDAVLGVDTLDDHHAHEDVGVLDLGRVAGEQRLHGIGLAGLHDVVHPASGDVHAGQVLFVHDVVHLGDDDAVFKGRRFGEHGGLLGVVARVQVAVFVGPVRGDEAHVGRQVHIQAAVQLEICMDGADAQLVVRQHLGQAQALHAGKGEVDLLGDALLEQIQMFIPGDGGDDHVQPVHLGRVQFGHGAGQEGRLLLVAALQHHFVTGVDDPLQKGDDVLCVHYFSRGILLYRVHALVLGAPFLIPDHKSLCSFLINTLAFLSAPALSHITLDTAVLYVYYNIDI